MSNYRSNLVEVDVLIVHRTPSGGVKVRLHEDASGVWLPLSAIEIYDDDGSNGKRTIALPEDLATEKGLV